MRFILEDVPANTEITISCNSGVSQDIDNETVAQSIGNSLKNFKINGREFARVVQTATHGTDLIETL